MNLLPKMFIFE